MDVEMEDLKPVDVDDLINEKFVKNGARKRRIRKVDCFYNIGYSSYKNKEQEGVVTVSNSWISFYGLDLCSAKKFDFSVMTRIDSIYIYDDKEDVIILRHHYDDHESKIRFPTAKSKAKFISCFKLRKNNAIKSCKDRQLAVQETISDTKSESCSEIEIIPQFNIQVPEVVESKLNQEDPIESASKDIDTESLLKGEDQNQSNVLWWNNDKPSPETIKQNLIQQNVATDIAIKLSEFAEKRHEKNSETFESDVSSIVKSNLDEVDLSLEKDDKKSQHSGLFSLFNDFVDYKNLQPILEKIKYNLIAKSVSIDVAFKLCETVERNMEGKVFENVESVSCVVKSILIESLEKILKSNYEHIRILKKCIEVQFLASKLFLVGEFCFINTAFTGVKEFSEVEKKFRPYVLTLCGVNGVGKTTSLAKICHWLVKNNLRVLIASCDTVKDGASEELETHVKNLNDLHPPQIYGGPLRVQFHNGIKGKDAKQTAMKAIKFATSTRIDVVLIDTASRMPDNQPLMRDFTIFIKVTAPDLLLFVGDAGTGNEAIKQFGQFNEALADSYCKNPRLIDGIVLTKFETIDDKVGAALSMAHLTGKPIVFVGTGQTYSDLKVFSAESVANALMK